MLWHSFIFSASAIRPPVSRASQRAGSLYTHEAYLSGQSLVRLSSIESHITCTASMPSPSCHTVYAFLTRRFTRVGGIESSTGQRELNSDKGLICQSVLPVHLPFSEAHSLPGARASSLSCTTNLSESVLSHDKLFSNSKVPPAAFWPSCSIFILSRTYSFWWASYI